MTRAVFATRTGLDVSVLADLETGQDWIGPPRFAGYGWRLPCGGPTGLTEAFPALGDPDAALRDQVAWLIEQS
ncbi:hypothetical protein A6A28_16815 [Streptomyces sp. CB03578]|nr:hypothetical protein A6A28_16815 [Streptomyces sp. CB03578]